MWFFDGKLIALYLCLIANLLQLGRSEDISDNSEIEETNVSTTESSFLSYIRPPRATTRSCSAPPQPENGEWRLNQDFCDEGILDCKVPEGTELGLGYQLTYSCRAGYRIKANHVVFCRSKGEWSSVPVCEEIRCDPLDSVSRVGHCLHILDPVNCDQPMLPKTWADLSCRPGYTRDTAVLTQRRNIVNCNEHGEWEPQPIRCVPRCGELATHQKPFVIGGTNAKITDFPWHATIYMKKNLLEATKKEFICGGTIIQADLVMTAAHCVYDETIRVKVDPRKLFVMTGNTFRDYDHPGHDPEIVKYAAVKQVITHYSYYGLRGNYASDLALLELQQPFVFSGILLPACLDISGFNAPYLDARIFGKVAGFGLTETGEPSPVLQTITVPYVSHDDCIHSKNAERNDILITKDKFCAGYKNGSAVCDGDSGGGLVFPKNDHWYVMGIVSVGLGVDTTSGARMCEKFSYTLYTRVSDYADWIFEVISNLDQRRLRLPSNPNSKSSTTTSPKSAATSRVTETPILSSTPLAGTQLTKKFSCFAPPPPTNGRWDTYPSLCIDLGYKNSDDCEVPTGVELEPGTELMYTCNWGYKSTGYRSIHCSNIGQWSSDPMCVEVTCDALQRELLIANCSTQWGEIVDCYSPVPSRTEAKVMCQPNFIVESRTKTGIMRCDWEGQWSVMPITCIPVFEPVCAQWTPKSKSPLESNETVIKVGDFPWHANIYEVVNTTKGVKKEFRCGASIITPKFLLTSAYCLYNRITKAKIDPAKLFIVTGSTFRDYDSPHHDPQTVKKSSVKSAVVYDGYDVERNRPDIAALEVEEPFKISEFLVPVCLGEDSLHTADILADGVFGKVPAFGKSPYGGLNEVLTALTVPYIPHEQCLKDYTGDRNYYICTAQANESTICEADNGSGLVFRANDQWYLMGIVSDNSYFDKDMGKATCARGYTIYTKVFKHLRWLADVTDRTPAYNGRN